MICLLYVQVPLCTWPESCGCRGGSPTCRTSGIWIASGTLGGFASGSLMVCEVENPQFWMGKFG